MTVKSYVAILVLWSLSLGVAQAQPLEFRQSKIVQLLESASADSITVAIAKANIGRAEASATALRAGPYEFEAALRTGRRKVAELGGQQQYTEWSGGLSRTLRLPGKRHTDQNLAKIEVQLANAVYKNAALNERLVFIDQWTLWSTAFQLFDISKKQAEEATRLADFELIQVEKGAGRQVSADQLHAEAELALLQAEQDEADMIRARMIIESNYPKTPLPVVPANFKLSETDVGFLLSANLGSTPKQDIAELTREKVRLTAQRARQDRKPDPTVGLEFTDEFGGRESAISAQISIPIGGSARRASSRLAQQQLKMSSLELDLANRLAQQQRVVTGKMVRLSRVNHLRAQDAVTLSLKALKKLEKGYERGAVTVSDLIRSRRSHYLVERIAVKQYWETEQTQLNLLAVYMSRAKVN